MENEAHYRCLERMYASGPINDFFQPTMRVSEGEAVIEIEILEQHHHAAGAAHGAVYFKMMDDAAYFAANSLEQKFFVLTTSFTTYLTRPISSGTMRAVGKVVYENRSQFIAEAVVYDGQGREIGRGNGVFVRGKTPLSEVLGYC